MTQQYGNGNSDIESELRKLVHFFPQPPEGFNPLTASPEEREFYGIPPQPDPTQQFRLARFWTEMYAPPLVFATPPSLLARLPESIRTDLRVTTTARREASLNWSGAYITPRDGQQFTEVHATWEIPLVTAPPSMPAMAEYRSSIWIGLDGKRRYFDSSLPQLGTAQFLNGPATVPPYHTWCQWWLRDHPLTYVPAILSVGVAPSQRVTAILRVVNETRVHCIIKNQTTNAILPFTMIAPTHTLLGRQVKISGATAEWVVERPAKQPDELYELPNYGTVHFTNCVALSAEMPAGGVPGPDRERTLDGARLIRMYKTERNPSRTVTLSKAEPPDVDQFRTLYVT